MKVHRRHRLRLAQRSHKRRRGGTQRITLTHHDGKHTSWSTFTDWKDTEMVTESSNESSRRSVFYLVGDSLTQDASAVTNEGWGALLQQEYVRSVDVVNRGLCGYNTEFVVDHALKTLCNELDQSFRPVLITLWLGANDAALVNGMESFLHVPVDQYRANLDRIITEFKQRATQAKLLLITPPVVDDEHRRRFQVESGGPSEPLDRTNEQAGIYAAACADVAASFSNVALLDLHTFFIKQYPDPTERHSFFADGLHFTKEGNRIVFEQVNEQIKQLLPAAILESWQFPDFRDVAQLY